MAQGNRGNPKQHAKAGSMSGGKFEKGSQRASEAGKKGAEKRNQDT